MVQDIKATSPLTISKYPTGSAHLLKSAALKTQTCVDGQTNQTALMTLIGQDKVAQQVAQIQDQRMTTRLELRKDITCTLKLAFTGVYNNTDQHTVFKSFTPTKDYIPKCQL